MISTIFFDLDGTLIDQKTAQNEACKTLYETYGFNSVVSESEFIQKWDKLTELYYDMYLKRECSYSEQREHRIADLFATYNIDMRGKSLLEIYDEYLYYFEKNWRTYPEIKSCLDSLKDFRLGVLTNGDSSQQKQKIEQTGLAPYFNHIICAGDYAYAKPDPRIFGEICKATGVPIAECLYVGDSFKSDIAPCLSIGMKCVFVNRNNKVVEDNICSIPTCENLLNIVSFYNKK